MEAEQLKFNKLIKEVLLGEVCDYANHFPNELDPKRVVEFLKKETNLFGRDSKVGHITCSSWVLDYSRTHVLLIYHQRLKRWIQPGGHIEPFETPRQGALREAEEESGIVGLKLLDQQLFHVNILNFPDGKDGPGHSHFDLRYLIQAPNGASLDASEEVGGAKWVPLNRLEEYSDEETILMMAGKTGEWLLKRHAAEQGRIL